MCSTRLRHPRRDPTGGAVRAMHVLRRPIRRDHLARDRGVHPPPMGSTKARPDLRRSRATTGRRVEEGPFTVDVAGAEPRAQVDHEAGPRERVIRAPVFVPVRAVVASRLVTGSLVSPPHLNHSSRRSLHLSAMLTCPRCVAWWFRFALTRGPPRRSRPGRGRRSVSPRRASRLRSAPRRTRRPPRRSPADS